jgi:transcriptional regulator with AAA-type ATPase domain
MNRSAMAEVGATTVSGPSSSRPASAGTVPMLAWLFPRWQTPTGLAGDDSGERVIGRDPSCAIELSGNDVSRRHAVLRRGEAGGTLIADLGSRNGVRVNGRLVASAPLVPGDVVRLGGWVGVITTSPGEVGEIAPGLWGGGALATTLAPLQRAATSDLPIVLEGETGTGKEMAAGALHSWSGRRGPLVAVNCAALPEGLAESELFGHRRGAFTGADRASPGFFRSAEGGTLLLDEVSDLPLPLQAKLLRVLEQREVQPLGETRPVPIDVRIVVAGQHSLMEAARTGRFRPDLLARLDGLTVRLPPLRERREDVVPLFTRLLADVSHGRAPAFDSEVAERLSLHDWPFNVRELVLLVRRLLTLHGSESTLTGEHLPARIGEAAASNDTARAGGVAAASTPAAAAARGEPVELPALIGALRTAGGNVARAAAMLGISRQRAYRLMEGQVDLDTIRGDTEKAR